MVSQSLGSSNVMSTDVVTFEDERAVGILRLNRPEVHNVVDDRVMTALAHVLDHVEDRPDLRCLILTGAGDVTFSAGGDLHYFDTLRTRDAGLGMSERMQALLNRLWQGPRPVIAAVNGQALGGGCELMTACHLRVAADHAVFSYRQAANGLTTGWGGGQRLFRLVGPSHALRLLLTAETIGASEALRIGLVNEVVPRMDLLAEARRLAHTIANNSAPAVDAFLRLARYPDDSAFAHYETDCFGEAWDSDDFKHALENFRRRRAPR